MDRQTHHSKMIGKHCIPYYRVSTDDQAERYSLFVQQQLMEQWAERNQVILDRHFVDDHSAKDFRRPGFTRLMEYIKQHSRMIDYVLIIDWSRFSRNIKESYIKIHELEQLGVEVQAIEQMIDNSIPEATIMKAIFLAAPDAENKRRSINVTKGMTASLRAGNWCGGKLPRGYWKDRNTGKVTTTSEAQIIAQAFDKIANHAYSLQDARTFARVRGLNISFQSFSKMIRNPFYKGFISHSLLGDDVVKGNQPAIVTPEIWQRVQDIISGNTKQHTASDLFPLKQWAACDKCGKKYRAYQVKKKQKKDGSYRIKKSQPIYYKCGCSDTSGAKMHEHFYELLKKQTIELDSVDLFRNKLKSSFKKMYADQITERAHIQKQLTEKRNFNDSLEIKFIEGTIDSDIFNKHKLKTKESIADLEKQLKSVGELSNPSGFVNWSMKLLTKIHFIWKESHISSKLLLQKLVFPEGVYYHRDLGTYRTPRINSIFTLKTALGCTENRKANLSNNDKLALFNCSSPNLNKVEPHLYVEDFIKIIEYHDILT